MIRFMGSFDKVGDLPNHGGVREYAFVGRSNVGKSSLVNAVLGEAVSRVSNTPGRTRALNLFNVNDKIWVMDLPGYGYAKVSKKEQIEWLERLEEYLTTRAELALLFILIDSRHGIKDSDKIVIDFCRAEKVPFQLVYTKADKKGAFAPDGAILTSAEKNTGIGAVKCLLK